MYSVNILPRRPDESGEKVEKLSMPADNLRKLDGFYKTTQKNRNLPDPRTETPGQRQFSRPNR